MSAGIVDQGAAEQSDNGEGACEGGHRTIHAATRGFVRYKRYPPVTTTPENPIPASGAPPPLDVPRRHLRLGWACLALFVLLGMTLEALHAFKIGVYLDVDNSTRRFMWTLAHAHGTLLALINLAFVALYDRLPLPPRRAVTVSHLLTGATVLVPGGFFLGGVRFHGGDPGLGVLLVPLGGTMLVIALSAIAYATR